jgi:hypothetical protein
MPQARGDGSGQTHAATQIQNGERCRRSAADKKLTDRRGAVPEFRPVGKVELIAVCSDSPESFQLILLVGDAIEDDVRISDLEKPNRKRIDLQRLFVGLVFQKTDAMEQSSALPHRHGLICIIYIAPAAGDFGVFRAYGRVLRGDICLIHCDRPHRY